MSEKMFKIFCYVTSPFIWAMAYVAAIFKWWCDRDNYDGYRPSIKEWAALSYKPFAAFRRHLRNEDLDEVEYLAEAFRNDQSRYESEKDWFDKLYPSCYHQVKAKACEYELERRNVMKNGYGKISA